jgi:hypothetical protein
VSSLNLNKLNRFLESSQILPTLIITHENMSKPLQPQVHYFNRKIHLTLYHLSPNLKTILKLQIDWFHETKHSLHLFGTNTDTSGRDNIFGKWRSQYGLHMEINNYYCWFGVFDKVRRPISPIYLRIETRN